MNNTSSATLQMVSAMCIFGSISVFVRHIPLPSSILALARGVVGMLFLLLVTLLRGKRPALADIRRNLLYLCLSGVFMGINWVLLFEAYHYTTVATATLCYYLAPIFVMLAAPFLLKERLSKVKIICVVVALAGMVLVSDVGQSGPSGVGELKGVALGVGAAALYAGVMLVNQKIKGISASDKAIIQLGSCALVLLPYALVTQWGAELSLSPEAVLLLLVVGVVHTGIAWMLYLGAMAGLKAQAVAVLSYIDPVVAILVSALLLKEPLGLAGILGAVMILGSALASELADHGPGK